MNYKTSIPQEILNYIELVEQDKIISCKEQKLLCELVRNAFKNEVLVYDQEQITKYLSYQRYFPFKLFDWEIFVFTLHNCIFREDGIPRWSDLFLLVGRGTGKNAYLSYEDFCLLTHTNGIYEYNIDISANSEEQAKTTFDDIYSILENPKLKPKLKKHFQWNKTEITNKKTRSTLKFRTNNASGKDGLRSGKVDFDEIHAYQDWDNINVFTTGLGKKPHPRRTYISTNGDVREGPLDSLIEKSLKILKGEMDDNGFLPFICRLDEENEVHDSNMWQKANPSLPYLPNLMEEMKKEYADYVIDPIKNCSFMTKRMNIFKEKKDTIVATWENILATKDEVPDLKGKSCVCGVDYAKTTDFVAVFLLFKLDDMYYGITHSWYCSQSQSLWRIKAPLDDWEKKGYITKVDDVEISPTVVTEWIKEQSKIYSIERIAIDSYRHSIFSRALKDIGYDAKDKKTYLSRPSDQMRVYPIINSLFVNQRIKWGDNPLMRWYTNNAKVEPAAHDNFTFGKIEPQARKTDGFMAFVTAMSIEQDIKERKMPKFIDVLTF